MKNLEKDIKSGTWKTLYLLYGEEEYLKNRYRDLMIKALVRPGDTLNLTKFSGTKINPADIMDMAQTSPFFAERRVIVAEDTGFFKKAPEGLADFMKTLPSTTCLIFIEKAVDKRSTTYKAVKKAGYPAEFKKQTTDTLKKWILGKVGQENSQITAGAVNALLLKVGEDMETLDRELEKLFSYTLKRGAITENDVEAITTSYPEDQIFRMLDALTQKQQKTVFLYYHDMLALKEPPMKIFALLIRQYRIVYHVKGLVYERRNDSEIAKIAGIPPFTVSKYRRMAKIYSAKDLLGILNEAAEYDEAIKTGKIKDTLAVELFLMKHSAS